jgi:thiamine biosynthesis lipoprotein
MACEISVQVCGADAARATHRVETIFSTVERQCTRFDPTSALMRANASADLWCDVPPLCFAAIAEAAIAHERTDGLFDPRVHDTLRRLGYDHTIPFEASTVAVNAVAISGTPPRDVAAHGRWQPSFDTEGNRLRIGPEPIDLGGIGKGLAVRWSTQELLRDTGNFAISAGGDCYLAGGGPDGEGWRVGVEDPRDASQNLAVLALRDRACATSSTRVRRWTVDGKAVHHLIDPRTGAPGGEGLMSVTVVAEDPAWAEVWSKSLFLCGRHGVAAAAARHELAALWISDDGGVGFSEALRPYLLWQAVA